MFLCRQLMSLKCRFKFDASSEGPAETSTPKKDIVMVDLTQDCSQTKAKPVKQAKPVESSRELPKDNKANIVDAQKRPDIKPQTQEIREHSLVSPLRASYHATETIGTPIKPLSNRISAFVVQPSAPALVSVNDDSNGSPNIDKHSEPQTHASKKYLQLPRHVTLVSSNDHLQRQDQGSRAFTVSPRYQC